MAGATLLNELPEGSTNEPSSMQEADSTVDPFEYYIDDGSGATIAHNPLTSSYLYFNEATGQYVPLDSDQVATLALRPAGDDFHGDGQTAVIGDSDAEHDSRMGAGAQAGVHVQTPSPARTAQGVGGESPGRAHQPSSVAETSLLTPGQAGEEVHPLHYAASTGNKKVVTEWIGRAMQSPGVLDHTDALGRPALVYAAAGGKSGIVSMLLEAGASVDVADSDGRTALSWAIYLGQPKIVSMLLKSGANVNTVDNDGKSFLHLMTRNANTKCFAAVTKHVSLDGMVVDVVDRLNMTPLHWAAYHNSTSNVKLLLKLGASIRAIDAERKTPLHYGVTNSPAVLKALLAADEDDRGVVNDVVNAQDVEMRTALHVAVGLGNVAIVSVLLGVPGCSLELQDADGRTALHWAVQLGHTEMVAKLLKAGGGRLNSIGDANGWTPLHYAVHEKYADVVKEILSHRGVQDSEDAHGQSALTLAVTAGNAELTAMLAMYSRASLHVADATGNTPLHRAAYDGNSEVVAKLIEANAPLDAMAADQTPLMYACERGHTGIIDSLVTAGADVAIADDEGRTCLHVASMSGHAVICTFLVTECKLDPNQRDHGGRTALHTAVYSADEATTSALIAAGADVDAQDDQGISALHWAASQGSLSCLDLLLKASCFPNHTEFHEERLTPLDYALMSDHGMSEEIAAALRGAGGLTVVEVKQLAAQHIQSWWNGYRSRSLLISAWNKHQQMLAQGQTNGSGGWSNLAKFAGSDDDAFDKYVKEQAEATAQAKAKAEAEARAAEANTAAEEEASRAEATTTRPQQIVEAIMEVPEPDRVAEPTPEPESPVAASPNVGRESADIGGKTSRARRGRKAKDTKKKKSSKVGGDTVTKDKKPKAKRFMLKKKKSMSKDAVPEPDKEGTAEGTTDEEPVVSPLVADAPLPAIPPSPSPPSEKVHDVTDALDDEPRTTDFAATAPAVLPSIPTSESPTAGPEDQKPPGASRKGAAAAAAGPPRRALPRRKPLPKIGPPEEPMQPRKVITLANRQPLGPPPRRQKPRAHKKKLLKPPHHVATLGYYAQAVEFVSADVIEQGVPSPGFRGYWDGGREDPAAMEGMSEELVRAKERITVVKSERRRMHIVRAKVEAARVIQKAFRQWVARGKPKPPKEPKRRNHRGGFVDTGLDRRNRPAKAAAPTMYAAVSRSRDAFDFDAELDMGDRKKQIAALTIQLAWRQHLRRRGFSRPAQTTLRNATKRRPRPLQANSPEVIQAKSTIRKLRAAQVYTHRQPMMQWRPKRMAAVTRGPAVKIPSISITAFNLAFDTYFPPEVKARFEKQATSLLQSETDADNILSQIRTQRGPPRHAAMRKSFIPDYARGKPVTLTKMSVY
mmetsp:Transcript_27512/g.72324  ORF Transcript_27512/g.72324 Transcript_27512/m.72324 type:complete len:1369 (+) Transcript_27512:1-4107(+)